MVKVVKAHMVFNFDKELDTTIHSLRADGGIDTFCAARVEPQVLELSGDVSEIAQWLTDTRWKHAQLCRGEGWILYHHFMRKAGTLDVFHAVVSWSKRGAHRPWPHQWPYAERVDEDRRWLDALHDAYHDPNWQGPLEELGVVFLDWYTWLMGAISKDKFKKEVEELLAKHMAKGIADVEDEAMLNALQAHLRTDG
jgi:hypothetical protein